MERKIKKISIALAGIMSAVAIAGVVPAGTAGTLGSVATIAHAETTTVTWRSADGIFPEANFDPTPFTYNGVTVNTDIYKDSLYRFAYINGSGTFTTSLGNFTKIEIAGGTFDGFNGTGWNGRTWSGKASSVPFNGYITSGDCDFTITFTIELPTVPATATYEQVGAYDAQFDGDTAASLWRVNVTAGTDSITSLDVKLGEYGSKEGAYTPTITDGHVVLGVVTNLTAAEVRTYGGFTVFANGDKIQTDAVAAD